MNDGTPDARSVRVPQRRGESSRLSRRGAMGRCRRRIPVAVRCPHHGWCRALSDRYGRGKTMTLHRLLNLGVLSLSFVVVAAFADDKAAKQAEVVKSTQA